MDSDNNSTPVSLISSSAFFSILFPFQEDFKAIVGKIKDHRQSAKASHAMLLRFQYGCVLFAALLILIFFIVWLTTQK